MKIASWNINSVRLRLARVLALLEAQNLDVLCLQETKVEDHLFPREAFEKAGYRHVHFSGEKSYNGVAIISRVPCTPLDTLALVNNDSRHIAVQLEQGIALHNFYVPAGGDEPDPEANPKFAHKLAYVEAMTEWAGTQNPADPLVLVGDLNIAPLPNDVWSHKQLLNVVSHTPAETKRLEALKQRLDFVDAARHFTPEEERLYSWWSYRNRDWRKSNRGRRLDHIWTTPALTSSLAACEILRDARDGEKPSDHVPVIVTLQ